MRVRMGKGVPSTFAASASPSGDVMAVLLVAFVDS